MATQQYSTKMQSEQDLEFYKSLYQDALFDLKIERKNIREAMLKLLQTKLPSIVEEILTPAQQRLLRVNGIRPFMLSKEEKLEVEQLQAQLERIRLGGCYNIGSSAESRLMSQQRLFQLKLEISRNLTLTFCFDIDSILEMGYVNSDLNLVDLPIKLNSGEGYRFPISEDDAESFLGSAFAAGIDVDRYKKMSIPSLDDINLKKFEASQSLKY